ncbi:MAG: tetratricopeptide repeat protein [Elusimicrobiaceae bacterium]|nr:tetratricopeptide repeat protein [Elusimicrobiaceae bacterium]
MSLNKILPLFLILLFLPLQSKALLGLTKRLDQKQKITAAREAYAKGNYEQAIEISKNFLMENQEAPKRRSRRIYSVLGNAYAALNDYDHALLIYNEALEVLPKDIELNLALANLYYKTELYDKAIEFYNKVLLLDKDNSNAMLGLGKSYLQIGFLSKSRQYFKDYLNKKGQKDNSVYYDYAVANFLSNNQNIALEYAQKAQEIDGNNPNIYFLIAKIYSTLNETEKAIDNIDKALELSNNREDILLTSLLWKAYRKDTAKEALKEIKDYQKQNPNSQLAVFIEGVSLLTQGQKQKAINVFKKIQNQNEDSFIKEIAEQIIKNN